MVMAELEKMNILYVFGFMMSYSRSYECRSFDTGKEPDLTIICQDRRYAVHRHFLCSRSHFFAGACRNPFREAEQRVIDLSKDDPETVDHMLSCEVDLLNQ